MSSSGCARHEVDSILAAPAGPFMQKTFKQGLVEGFCGQLRAWHQTAKLRCLGDGAADIGGVEFGIVDASRDFDLFPKLKWGHAIVLLKEMVVVAKAVKTSIQGDVRDLDRGGDDRFKRNNRSFSSLISSVGALLRYLRQSGQDARSSCWTNASWLGGLDEIFLLLISRISQRSQSGIFAYCSTGLRGKQVVKMFIRVNLEKGLGPVLRMRLESTSCSRACSIWANSVPTGGPLEAGGWKGSN